MSGRPELADQVAVILQRAHPNELSKEELVEQAGLSTTDLRTCLDALRQGGELDESGDGYRWVDPAGELTGGGDEELVPDKAADGEQPLATELVDDSGRTNRFVLEVTGNFKPARGATDEANVRQAAAIAEEIQNVLGTALPAIGTIVLVKRLEAYDKPRVVYDAEAAAEADSEEQS